MIKKLFIFCCLLLMTCSFPSFAAERNFTNTVTIEPKASYVFNSVSAAVSPSAYGGDCALMSKGSGTLTIYLQKYASASNSWITVSNTTSSKSFSNTSICAHSKSKILSKGKYRAKTYVKATVGSHTDSRTVYSGTLTIN
ncbi:MAG: hypothetical protein Q4B70_00355 [Lachnospiraceae bacterium]|nr:hypothetical protein [Lachnospiraceae bacterium]